MKKIIALILAAAMMLALTGCFGGNSNQIQNATTDEEAEKISAKDFDKDFDGLNDYLLEKGYVFGKDGSGNSLTSEIKYEIIGANDGIRYYFTDNKTFIEIYDFSGKQNDTAKKILADIEDDGKFRAIDGLDELTGVISKSGKYVIIYNANNKFEYEKITDALENW